MLSIVFLTSSAAQTEAQPGAPTLIGPSGPGASTQPVYEWNEVAGATAYFLLVIESGVTFHSEFYAASVCTPSPCSAAPVLPHSAGEYFWAVVAWEDSTAGPASDTFTFNVGLPPVNPVDLIAPTGAGIGSSPTYEWTHVPDATGYALTVVDSSGSAVVTMTYEDLATTCPLNCSVTPTAPLANGAHAFVVTPFNGSGNGPAADGAFRVGPPLSAPQLHSPEGRLYQSPDAAPDYAWDAVSEALFYFVWVYTVETQENVRFGIAPACGGGGTCTFTPSPDWSLPSGDYFWFAAALDASGIGLVGGPLVFSAATSPPAAPPTFAPDGLQTSPAPPYEWEPVWGVETYDLETTDASGAVVFSGSYPSTSVCAVALCSVTGELLAQGSYTWSVRGVNPLGAGDWSAPRSFGVERRAPVAAGGTHSIAATPTGDVWTWGDNAYGQLGNASSTPISTVPVPVALGGVRQVAAGEHHAIALDENGTVWVWGRNDFGQLGDAALGLERDTPFELVGLPVITSIAAGKRHSLAVDVDGGLWAWGRNTYGQVGNAQAGGIVSAPVRVQVDGGFLDAVVDVAGGQDHSLAIRSDGSLWSFGRNASGQLGVVGPQTSDVAIEVTALSSVVAIGAGDTHSVALTSDGSLHSWGSNANGRLGTGSSTPSQRTLPGPVVAVPPSVGISVGNSHNLALAADGSVWGWGQNTFGRIGTGGTETSLPSPVELASLSLTTNVAAGGQHSLGVTAGDFVWGWGRSSANRQVGDGTNEDRHHPTSLSGPGFDWRVGTPTFSPAGGVFPVAVEQMVTVSSATPGATIHYTIDGSTPDAQSDVAVGGEVTLAESTTLRAIAVKTGSPDSNVDGADFELKVATPSLTPGTNTYHSEQAPQLVCTTLDATYHYSTDGAPPDETDPEVACGGAIPVNVTQTLHVVGFKDNWTASNPRVATYTLKVPAPMLAFGAGTYTDTLMETVTAGVPGVSIHLTQSGLVPTQADPALVSGGTVPISTTSTLKLRGFRTGWTTSDLVAASYEIRRGPADAPVPSPSPGTYASAQSVSLTSTPGSLIRYTTNGTTPTSSSPIYVDGAPILIEQSTTLQAVAFAADFTPSAVSTADYVIASGLSVETPTILPGTGFYSSPVDVTIDSQTPGAAIFITTDGTEPTEQSTPFAPGGVFTVDKALRLRAKAFKDGSESNVRTADYGLSGALGAGSDHGLVVSGDGALFAWGHNNKGQIGDGQGPSDRETPFDVGLTDIVAAVGGAEHTLALDGSGQVWAWGENGDGQLGLNDTLDRPVPQSVGGFDGKAVVQLAAGQFHSLALDEDGHVWAWGRDDFGQVGNGAGSADVLTPSKVSGLSGVTAVAAGVSSSSSFALRTDGLVEGDLWAWGRNTSFELGDGTQTHRVSPVQVSGFTDVVSLGPGPDHMLIVRADGSAWGWGNNLDGKLGIGTEDTLEPLPVRVADLMNVRAVSGGISHSIALLEDGGVWAFGSNSLGQLGETTSNSAHLLPRRVSTIRDIVAIDGGINFNMALTRQGQVWVWGQSQRFQLAADTGFATSRALPLPIAGFPASDNTWLFDDPDQDGLTTVEEIEIGSDPRNPDTNADGVLDGAAVRSAESATALDMDGDTIANALERELGTDPFGSDSDGDGVNDGVDDYPLDPDRFEAPAGDPSDMDPPEILLEEPTNAVKQQPPL